MKTSLSFFILFMVSCGFAVKSYAQGRTSASATVFATILTPVSIERIQERDLSYVNLSGLSKTNDILISGKGEASQLKDGIVHLPGAAIITIAKFMVNGEDFYSFAITLPVSPINLLNNSSNEKMTVNSFKSTSGTTGGLSARNQTLKIEASLFYNTDQAHGIYTSAIPIDVTVNYN